MKIQDIIFLIVLLFLLFKRDEKWFASFGIASLVLSIPFFANWVFFTAEKLIWYAAAFFLISIIIHLLKLRKLHE